MKRVVREVTGRGLGGEVLTIFEHHSLRVEGLLENVHTKDNFYFHKKFVLLLFYSKKAIQLTTLGAFVTHFFCVCVDNKFL